MAKRKAAQRAAKPKPAKGEPGRPQWSPSDFQRGQIQGWVEAGYTQDQIAARLEVDRKTLTKHCNSILQFARMDMIAAVVRNAFRFAVGAPAQFDDNGNQLRAEVVPQAWAICFILKTLGKKLGFSERIEVTGPNGDPLLADLTAVLSKLTDKELGIIEHAQRILAAHAPQLAGPTGDRPTTH